MKFSSPFLGTFFQYNGDVMKRKGGRKVFVPFLGDFLSIKREYHDSRKHFGSFRPLSWGLSFNIYQGRGASHVFSVFSSPFLGTFFQFGPTTITWNSFPFSSPFLGTFFQWTVEVPTVRGWRDRFRPLSWGLSFNRDFRIQRGSLQLVFSTPFLGTFFQLKETGDVRLIKDAFSSPFLGTFFQFWRARQNEEKAMEVFVPFLGDFLSIRCTPTTATS